MVGIKRVDKQFLALITASTAEGAAFSSQARLLNRMSYEEYWRRYGAYLELVDAQLAAGTLTTKRGATASGATASGAPAADFGYVRLQDIVKSLTELLKRCACVFSWA